MGPEDSHQDSTETIELLRRAERGESTVLDDLLERHRDRLRRVVVLRMAEPLRNRIDASDVIQDAMLEASQRLGEYVRNPVMPFYLWLRFLTCQRLANLHRRHLGTKARDPRREVALFRGAVPEATTQAMAARLLGNLTSPSAAAARAEVQVLLQEALNRLDPEEREILALRHFEQLTNVEAARVLGIGEAAASKRYIRSLSRMKGILIHLKLDEGLR